jgi:hypothetical protein
MHSLSIFGVRTRPRETQIHKTQHGPNLVESTTFPLIVYYVPFHKAHIQMAFCGNPKILKVGVPATLGPHNFVCKPLIQMKYEVDL